MAQLTDDCFAFGGNLPRIDAALAMIAAETACVADSEEVSLAAADGRVLAQDVMAGCDLPPFDNAAVDGYEAVTAVRPGDSVGYLSYESLL